jgi:VWFA-related protein
LSATIAVLFVVLSILPQGVAGHQPATPRFRAAVQVVSVSAVVRDRRGRYVRDLTREDFQIFDRGARRPIVDFFAEESAPASVAILFDVSGSMVMSTKLVAARDAARHVLAALDAGGHTAAALFTFDTALREAQPFTSDLRAVRGALERVAPYGGTSIFDAIQDAAGRLMQRGGARRALVVITDGVDTYSERTANEAALAASAVDVPVYVVTVRLPVDDLNDEASGRERGADRREAVMAESSDHEIARLAERTGGAAFIASAPAHASVAARRIVAELRHQYLLAIEAGPEPGWHSIEVRARDRDLRVRARAGYLVGHPRTVSGVFSGGMTVCGKSC